jgi:hypothetical protein
MSRDNSLNIGTGCWLDGRGSISRRTRYFSSLYSVQTGSGALEAPYPTSTGMNWSGLEADHSPSSSAKVEKGGNVPPLPILHYGVVLNEVSRETTLALPFYLSAGCIHDHRQHSLPELSLELFKRMGISWNYSADNMVHQISECWNWAVPDFLATTNLKSHNYKVKYPFIGRLTPSFPDLESIICGIGTW